MNSHPLAVQCLPTRPAEGITWAAALLALTVQASGAEATLVDKAKQFFKPLPQDMATAEFPTLAPRVALGKKLFFERVLMTPSPFDAYLRGNAKALTSQAQVGLKRFIEVGCVSCRAEAPIISTHPLHPNVVPVRSERAIPL